ncbi:MAG: histidine kinase [Balneola sp.]
MHKKKYLRYFFAIGTLIISMIGMAEYKQQLEVEKLLKYEVYFWGFTILFWLTIGVIIAQLIYERWRFYQELKNEHARAELELLKIKVDPHFFFNTLNNLYGLTVEKSEKAPEVILKLSEIMRYVIYDSNEELVSLKREVEYIGKYLEIHQIRFHKEVDISLEKDIIDESVKVAPLMLIVLIENAFKHGVEPLVEGAYMNIRLKSNKRMIHFKVENNYKPSEKSRKGIGLSNLKKRLQLIYPDSHHLSIQNEKSVFTADLKIELR